MGLARAFALCLAAAALAACGDDGSAPVDGGAVDSGTVDSGTVDSGTVDSGALDAAMEDGGVVPDAGAGTAQRAVFLSNGGGTASSASFRVGLSVGTPQPMGTASSSSYRVQLGPSAAGSR